MPIPRMWYWPGKLCRLRVVLDFWCSLWCIAGTSRSHILWSIPGIGRRRWTRLRCGACYNCILFWNLLQMMCWLFSTNILWTFCRAWVGIMYIVTVISSYVPMHILSVGFVLHCLTVEGSIWNKNIRPSLAKSERAEKWKVKSNWNKNTLHVTRPVASGRSAVKFWIDFDQSFHLFIGKVAQFEGWYISLLVLVSAGCNGIITKMPAVACWASNLITGSLVRTHSGESFVVNFASLSPASAWPSLA